ncbi:hypothetical protein M514_08572 [Trichuris suis]|uniref:Helix-turn-helix domain-containing protein n=1 Tax=Trichuris suis TaxID=68888 RepID=A0A085N1X7_9BILA|nr:hypothetical protein M513_08572 [Trichuris suis]KFD63473.1 hypothetical protein M514_08572 [Trichuris suis]
MFLEPVRDCVPSFAYFGRSALAVDPVNRTRRSTEADYETEVFPGTILFTMGIEQHGRLPFLDTPLIQKGANLSSHAYGKPTNTVQFIHYTSNHPLGVKRGLIIGTVDRAYYLCDPQNLERELRYIKTILCPNGYPHHIIDSTLARRVQHLNNNGHAPPPILDRTIIVSLPFYPGISDKIQSLSRVRGFVVRLCIVGFPLELHLFARRNYPGT